MEYCKLHGNVFLWKANLHPLCTQSINNFQSETFFWQFAVNYMLQMLVKHVSFK